MATLPTVIDKTATVNIGGGQFKKNRLALEIETQSLADVRAMLQQITAAETANQIRLGNPPQVLEVDNATNKQLAAVQQKAVVLFGTLLAAAAMRMVETELRANIAKSTTARSGTLSNIAANWEWRFVQKGGRVRVVKTAAELPSFGRGDKLVLVPVGVPHATLTNRNVARSGRVTTKATKRRAAQRMGFLGMTARTVRRRAEFRQFAVIAEFTKAHMIPGELMTRTQGTGVLTIRPRFRIR